MAPEDDENVGSRARDHLANERTYLAWLRTALGTIALGIALVGLADDPSRSQKLLSIIFITGAAALIVLATIRYFEVRGTLDEGRFRTSRWLPFAVSVVTVLVAIVAVLFVVL